MRFKENHNTHGITVNSKTKYSMDIEKIKKGFERFTDLFNDLLKGKSDTIEVKMDIEEIIYTDTDVIEEGSLVFSDEAMTETLEDGTYTTADNSVFEVTDGEVVSFVPAETTEKETNRRIARLVAKLAVKEAELAAHKAEKERFVAAAKAAKDEFEAFKKTIIDNSNYKQ